MKKSFKLVAAVAVAAMTLTSCAKKISGADAETQAGKYDQSKVTDTYKDGSETTKTTVTKASGTFELVISVAGITLNKESTDTETVTPTIVTAAEIKSVSSSYGTSVTFYLKGSALSYKVDYTGTTSAFTSSGTGTTKGSASYTAEGLPSASDFTTVIKVGDSNELDMHVVTSYTWNKK